ncbi:hypothetical protein MBM_08625 [Drepanopeziza brunnea f. sp. 'multigermtubi' MB_m1]|uniref:Uncharacterized protein n=2 Tax=Drepanopeziza brunnea f. sp. 'multigermtubi' TaxID=698441 RepID=K1WLR3_MARBU|nr:uncharacterized protein MBM_08625 [Drepanopeziza brunnea f. sp. 'multigermtubi' MB_m1]EKD13182.1 hypothetical protein MBM_08625 [Drepanopeziza brunnea f. sp. 'multigermtubi' MB_m1]
MRRHSTSHIPSQVKSPTRSASSHNTDKASSSADNDTPPPREAGTSLATARRLAQHRIEATAAATTSPGFHTVVWNEHGALVERSTIGFLGTVVESKVFYSLRRDVEGSDEAVLGVDRGVGGLLDRGEDGIETGREGCTGSWNLDGSVVPVVPSGKLGRQRDVWWHTERARWREVPLERFCGGGRGRGGG